MNEQKESIDKVDAAIAPAASNETSNAGVVKYEDNRLGALNLFQKESLDAAIVILERITKSSKSGISSVNDGLACLIKAQDLKIPFSSAIENMQVINNKTGINVHLIKALLLRAGVTWRKIKDYTPLYEYTDGINVYLENQIPDYAIKFSSSKEAAKYKEEHKDDNGDILVYPVTWYQDFKGNKFRSYILNGNYQAVASAGEAQTVAKNNKIPIYRIPNQAVDYITEYEFTRNVNGKEMVVRSSFTYTEATTAEMFDKDTYKKYAKVMIGHRAFTYGARDIASDVLMGCMEMTELKIMNNQRIDARDLDGVEEATVINISE